MKMTQPSTDPYVAPNQIRIDEFYKRMGINNEQERLAVLTQRDTVESPEPSKRSYILRIVTTSKEI